MTDWTNPRTWTVGEKVTKAILDIHIRDNLNHLKESVDAMESIPPLTVESAIFPKTDSSATIRQTESSTGSPKPNWLELVFPNSSDSNIHWKRVLPTTIGSTAILRVHGYMESATSGNIGFGVRIAAISDGDANIDAKAFASTNTGSEAVPASAKTKFVLDITLTNKDSWSGGDEVIIDLYRNTAVASNATGNCIVTKAQLLFTA